MKPDELLSRVQRALVANGFAEAIAAPIARSITACERDGTLSHGLLRLPGFVESVRSGWADGKAMPVEVSRSPSMLVLDAMNGFTHYALENARGTIMAKASRTGTVVLLIRNAHHFSALWPDIEGFAREGFVAFSCVTSRARLTAWSGGGPVFGTNASAFACPRAEGDPVVWDQAASILSQGDLLLAVKEGRRIPLDVGVDANGEPTDDPNAILKGGALHPFGGRKGASIAFMVEILASALSGGVFGYESPAQGTMPSKGGQFLMLIDPRRAGADVATRVEGLVDAVHAAGSPDLPGSRRYRRRAQAFTDGILVSDETMAMLDRLAGA
ncbi:MAG: Ldh family oxidoreductase [Betaproteobacteria bacterium]|nr:Ldh family oxidoreductase [Betaproteobacteria bacterium]